MNLAKMMLDAMTCEGNRFHQAWLMGKASYYYTRSHGFGRLYALRGGIELFWDCL